MILPVEYTKGLEFDAVILLDPTRTEYPVDDGHAKLLYVAATRALHELCVLHTGNLTGLIADPLPERIAKEAISEDRALPENNAQYTTAAEKENITQSKPAVPKTTKPAPKKKVSIVHVRQPEEKSNPKQLKENNATANISLNGHKYNNSNESKNNFSYNSNLNKTKSPSADQISIHFGDMPATEKLRPAGHSKIDLAIRWVTKQPDGLYLQSRYGILRLSPVGSAIIRITFTKKQQFFPGTNAKIAVSHIDKTWMYREVGGAVELLTDELCLQVEKTSGRICFMTRDKKPLLTERTKECRQIETGLNGQNNTWNFFDWTKGENLYAMGAQDTNGMNLRGSARYFSHGENTNELPLLLSDKGYGILFATDGPALCCDIPSYGSYLHTEKEEQIDYYFIAGKRPATIMNAYAYLCGRL